MKARFLAFLAALFIVRSLIGCTTAPATLPAPAQRLTIQTGTTFGMCIGYCRETLVITPKGALLTKSSNKPDDRNYPDIRLETDISAAEWDNIVAQLDIDAFVALPEVIGCPDCADGGAEWIEVSVGDTTDRVEFEYGASIPEIDDLILQLRDLRQTLSARLET